MSSRLFLGSGMIILASFVMSTSAFAKSRSCSQENTVICSDATDQHDFDAAVQSLKENFPNSPVLEEAKAPSAQISAATTLAS